MLFLILTHIDTSHHRFVIKQELAELKEQEKSFKAKWQSEKTLMDKIQQNKVEIENLKFEAEKAEREGDYGKVAEIRYGKQHRQCPQHLPLP